MSAARRLLKKKILMSLPHQTMKRKKKMSLLIRMAHQTHQNQHPRKKKRRHQRSAKLMPNLLLPLRKPRRKALQMLKIMVPRTSSLVI